MNTKGWRTFAVGAAFAVVPPFLTYVVGVNWVALGLTPELASMIVGIAMMGLRLITSTPPGVSK